MESGFIAPLDNRSRQKGNPEGVWQPGKSGKFSTSAAFLSEFGSEHLGDEFWIRLGRRGLHDLAGEEIEQLFVAHPYRCDLARVVGDDRIAESFEFTGLSGLEAQTVGDGAGVLGWLDKHHREHLTGLAGCQRAIFG